MAESDWDTVTVLRKKGPTAAQAKSKQAIIAAQRKGDDVETSKKCMLQYCFSFLLIEWGGGECVIFSILCTLGVFVCLIDTLPVILQTGSAGQNKQHTITKNTAKLDRETEELHHDRVSLEVGKVIQQSRQGVGMTQKDLATKINEKPQVIADYESGKAIPSNQVMGKIERALGKLIVDFGDHC
ncbi:endothelial differentiation-related factor 1 [Pelobates cultripes]|uniref:Endothelial differentiation-related factor 1 n=1 Tax=Pelobates cultripes TaxID=61616 RepID=A0AAD1WQB6_PELCU|nr:endothelial differentiation-related factor 1 [Pelobates cultripes]